MSSVEAPACGRGQQASALRVGEAKFLELDRNATKAPGELHTPEGHYRKMARNLGREGERAVIADLRETQVKALAFAISPDYKSKPQCERCEDGKLGDGYCTCKVGETLKAVDEYKARRSAGERA